MMVRFICIFWTRPHHIVGNSIYPSKYLHLYPLYPLVSYPGKYPLVSEILNSNCINIPEDISQPTGWYQTATIISMVFPQTDPSPFQRHPVCWIWEPASATLIGPRASFQHEMNTVLNSEAQVEDGFGSGKTSGVKQYLHGL